MSSAYNYVRTKRGEDERSMAMFIREKVQHQERLEAAGYQPPTWRVLRTLQLIPTLGNTAARRNSGDGSSLLPKCRQRNIALLGERARTNCLLVGWPG